MAALFFVGASSASTQAAVGDRGTDQSEYQGAYGKQGYGDEKFEFSQIGGYYNGSFVPHWTYNSQVQTALARDNALTPTFTRSFRVVGKLTKC